jgi:tetrahydromethanopterin S-methyltransferase subunit G
MEQPSIPERLARIEVHLTHMPTRVELYEKLDELRHELRMDLSNRIGEVNHRMDIFQADVNRRFELLAAELQRQGEQQRAAISKLYVFIIGTALTSLTLGLGGMTLILTQLPLAR